MLINVGGDLGETEGNKFPKALSTLETKIFLFLWRAAVP